ncbi:low temperature requirement protein A, partial [Microbacterium sp. GbtcB4]|uniref:low temperature requirement protein A n=1 Tax=Microbacterium sp. GbtcB4 TaxID=2824749 RepID=UPI001C3079F1
DFTLPVIGYVVVRVAVDAQGQRASRPAGPLRSAALRYAGGIAAVQVLWSLFLLVPSGPVQLAAIIVFALIEIAVPVIA